MKNAQVLRPRTRPCWRLRIMHLLRDGTELTGAEVARAASIKKGSVYTTLHRLERDGLVTSRVEEQVGLPGSRRRYYKITVRGKRFVLLQAELMALLDR